MSSQYAARKQSSSKRVTFPMKMHELLRENEDVIQWTSDGKAWTIIDRDGLITRFPKYFKHDRFKSFMQQVHAWGFKRVSAGIDSDSSGDDSNSESITYQHELFVRDEPELSLHMERKRQTPESVPSMGEPALNISLPPLDRGLGGSSTALHNVPGISHLLQRNDLNGNPASMGLIQNPSGNLYATRGQLLDTNTLLLAQQNQILQQRQQQLLLNQNQINFSASQNVNSQRLAQAQNGLHQLLQAQNALHSFHIPASTGMSTSNDAANTGSSTYLSQQQATFRKLQEIDAQIDQYRQMLNPHMISNMNNQTMQQHLSQQNVQQQASTSGLTSKSSLETRLINAPEIHTNQANLSPPDSKQNERFDLQNDSSPEYIQE